MITDGKKKKRYVLKYIESIKYSCINITDLNCKLPNGSTPQDNTFSYSGVPRVFFWDRFFIIILYEIENFEEKHFITSELTRNFPKCVQYYFS